MSTRAWSAVHVSSLLTIREQPSFGSAGRIAGSSTHLIPERKRLTGIEERDLPVILPVRFLRVVDCFPEMAYFPM